MSITSTQDRTWEHKGNLWYDNKYLEAKIDVFKHENANLEHKKYDDKDQNFQCIQFQVEQVCAKSKLVRLN